MVPILTLLLVIVLSILVTRIATIALIHTGLSRESARFQARSAFTGSGFTTNESERVVGHPVRRRIVMLLMLLGNAGIVTAVASLMLTFVGTESAAAAAIKVAALVLGITALWALTLSTWVESRLSRLISWALSRYTNLEVKDYVGLMHLSGEYQIAELKVDDGDWVAGKTLRETGLREEGVLVLGIERPDGYLGAPLPDTEIRAQDRLLVYGRASTLESVDVRRRDARGDEAHRQEVETQRHVAGKKAVGGEDATRASGKGEEVR